MMKAPSLALAALGASLILMGCSTQRISLCPGAAILADAAKAPVFRSGAPYDLSGVAYTASFTDVTSTCTFDRLNGKTQSNLDISVRATRTPTAEAASVTVPYFITVSASDRVLSKKIYQLRLDFAPGAAVASTDLTPDRIEVTLERSHQPTDYQLLVGFQLSPEQLGFNRTLGRYTP